MNRRQTLALLSAGVALEELALAQQHAHTRPAAQTPARLRFFTAEELRLVRDLFERILPADDHSPGAAGAKVPEFADWLLSHAPASRQSTWRAGLRSYQGLDATDVAARFNAADPFFLEMRRMVLHGYYTSEIGIRQELGYVGTEVLAKFPGCPESGG